MTFSRILLFTSLSALIFSCKKSNTNESTVSSTPLTTTHGRPIGTASKATIGANGGSVSMPDHYISIQVPAGAVDAATEFSVQEVEVNDSAHTGRLFRILPEGVTLKKPVEITFSYTDEDLASANEDYFYPCFQSTDGTWHKVMDCTLDKAQRTLKVSTTHFSDWSILREVTIHSPKHEIGSGEEVDLEAFVLDEYDGTGLLKPSSLTDDQIVGWKIVQGGGSISGGKHTVVKYTAPETDGQIEAIIEVTVKKVVSRTDPKRPGNGGLVIVRKSITILPEEYVTWVIGGETNSAMFFSIGVFNGQAVMTATAVNSAVSFHTSSIVLGKYDFGKLTEPKKANLTASYKLDTFESGYTECDTYKKVFSDGTIVFDKFGESGGGMVQGSFSAVLYNLKNCDVSARNIAGHFRIRRTY